MKKLLLTLSSILVASLTLSAQTAGTLTFSFTEVAKTPTYNGNSQHVLAVWIQNTTGTGTGTFVKTKLRYVGSGTNDHLPTWAANCGCASSTNALGTACNIVDATTGATRSSWTSYTVTWDGKKGAAATGTLQPDGVYKVTIQSTWNHGTSGTATTSYTFTKGPSTDHQTPANNANWTGVVLDWVPNVTGVEENTIKPQIEIYPNPSTGIINVDYSNTQAIKVLNTLGEVVYEETIEEMEQGTKAIDLSKFSNGIYFINVSNQNGASNHKVILDK